MATEHVIADIDLLSELPRDWDSYGAEPVSSAAQDRAKRCWRVMSELWPPVPDPKVGPTPDGGVALIWRRGKGVREVELRFTAVAQRLLMFQDRRVIVQESIDVYEAPKRLLSILLQP